MKESIVASASAMASRRASSERSAAVCVAVVGRSPLVAVETAMRTISGVEYMALVYGQRSPHGCVLGLKEFAQRDGRLGPVEVVGDPLGVGLERRGDLLQPRGREVPVLEEPQDAPVL